MVRHRTVSLIETGWRQRLSADERSKYCERDHQDDDDDADRGEPPLRKRRPNNSHGERPTTCWETSTDGRQPRPTKRTRATCATGAHGLRRRAASRAARL